VPSAWDRRQVAGVLIAALVVTITIGVFTPALSPEWVNWDDPGMFLENPHYRGLGPRQLAWMFTSPTVRANGAISAALRRCAACSAACSSA